MSDFAVSAGPIDRHLDVQTPVFRCVARATARGVVWILVSGELDLATVPRLKQVLREAEVHPRRVLDLRGLTFMDCAGVHVIVEADARAKAGGGELVLVRGPSQVDRVLALTGTAETLEIVDLDPFQPSGQAILQPP